MLPDESPLSDADYSPLVIEHFAQPRNVGDLAAGIDVVRGSAGRRDRGAQFTVSARVTHGRVVEARFTAYGCPHCIAAGSLLTMSLIGSDLHSLQGWSWRDVADALQIPTTKRGRLLILEDAVRAMAEDWGKRF